MWVKVRNRNCKECGRIGGTFFAQRQRKIQITINNICKDCKAKKRSEYYYKHEKHQRYLKYVGKER